MINPTWKILHLSDIDTLENTQIYIAEQSKDEGPFQDTKVFTGNKQELRKLVEKCNQQHRYVIWHPREIPPVPPKKFSILLPCLCMQQPRKCEFEDDGYCSSKTPYCQDRMLYPEIALF